MEVVCTGSPVAALSNLSLAGLSGAPLRVDPPAPVRDAAWRGREGRGGEWRGVAGGVRCGEESKGGMRGVLIP